jgi:hypothetical protein
MTTPQPKRRWLRFRLRTLLVLVVVLSVPLGWVAMNMQQARRQREAVKAILEAGGVVWYRFEMGDGYGYGIKQFFVGTSSALLGKDMVDSVGSVRLGGQQITDDNIASLTEFEDLLSLHLLGTRITDGGLEHIRGLRNLMDLSLGSPEITDHGMDHLKGLTSLYRLQLQNTQVTDEGIQKLQEALPNCEIICSPQP